MATPVVWQENMKVLAQKWKNMSEASRRPYEVKAKVEEVSPSFRT